MSFKSILFVCFITCFHPMAHALLLDQKPAVLYLKWHHNAQFAGVYMAMAKGYFAEEGVNVVIKDYDESAPAELIKQNVVDYAISGPRDVLTVTNDKVLAVIGAFGQQSLWDLAMHPDIESVRALSGKTVALTRGTGKKLMSKLIEEHYLVDVNLVFYRDIEQLKTLLREQKIDAVLGYRTSQSYYYEQVYPGAKHYNPYVIGKESIAGQLNSVTAYSDVLLTSQDEVEHNPQRARAILRAISRGWYYSINHPHETLEYMINHYPVLSKGHTLAQVKYELAVMSDVVYNNHIEVGFHTLKRWQMILAAQNNESSLPLSDFNLDDVFWDQSELWLQELKYIEQRQMRWRQILTLCIVVVCLINAKRFIFLVKRFLRTREIKRGIKKKQFIFHFQPLCDSIGCITGYEALVRWKHPNKGLLAPYHFIEEIEEDDELTILFDRYIVRKAAKFLHRNTLFTEHDWSLAVNVSNLFMMDPKTIELLKALKYAYQLDGLELEVTERLEFNKIEELKEGMERIKALGVDIALDDYGVGYSSLNVVNQLPIDKLKIDRALIADVVNDRKTQATIHSIFTLAKTHGIKVVLEGVEECAQIYVAGSIAENASPVTDLFVNPVNTDTIKSNLILQGFYFSKPRAFEDFSEQELSHGFDVEEFNK